VLTEILLPSDELLSVRMFFVRLPCKDPEIDPEPSGIEPLRSICSAVADENGNTIPADSTNTARLRGAAICLP
jgi:hypothetical protein